MTGETIKSALLGEQYHRYVLDNGLTLLVYPIPEKKGAYALLGTKFGSTTRSFTLGGRRVEVPAGIAHFLEHKLFESEEGDAFDLFAKTGASANAYTSFDKTCYLFSASINIEESLRTLIRFVTSPHFTEQTVAKEQGIIGQEIKMYDDSADWAIATMSLQSLYRLHPVRDDIAGTVESIAEITPGLLYDCYNAFYRPQNMALAVAGRVDPQRVLEICREEYAAISAPAEPVVRAAVAEPPEIAEPLLERRMQVFAPEFSLAYKEEPFDPANRTRQELGCRMILELAAGETSPLYRRLYDGGLINDTFETSSLDDDDYLCVTFGGESENPQAAAREIQAELAAMQARGLDPERFEELRREIYGSAICGLDSVENTATKMLYAEFKNASIYDILDEVQAITCAEVEAQLRRMFRREKSALSVVWPTDIQE